MFYFGLCLCLGFVIGALANVGYHWFRDLDNRYWFMKEVRKFFNIKD